MIQPTNDFLQQYLARYSNLGPFSMTPGREGGADQWFAPGGQNASPYGDGNFLVYGQGNVDPDGTPGRGGMGGIYSQSGQLQGNPFYQQPTNIDWSGPASIALSALGGAYMNGGFGGADLASSGGAGWTSGYDLAGGGGLEGWGGGLSPTDLASAGGDPAQVLGGGGPGPTGGPDFFGSDWASGAPTGPTGGMLPTTAMGTTAANAAAASGVPGAVNAGGAALGLGDIAKLGSAAAGLASYASAANAPTSATSTATRTLDPRADANLWGGDGSQWGPNGINGTIAQASQTPLPSGVQAAGTMANEYLTGGNGGADLSAQRNAINRQLTPNAIQAPQMTAAQAQGSQAQGTQVATPTGLLGGVVPQAQQMSAAQINAPKQNNLDLTDYYKGQLGGNPASNPYVQQQVDALTNSSRYNFGNLLGDLTQNFQEKILPSLKGNAILNGSLGGSREAMSEAIAARDLDKQAGRAAVQANSDLSGSLAAMLSSVYNTGADRQANLLNQLSGQQYGVGTNNAGFQQGAGQTNAQLGTTAGIAGAGNQTNIIGANNNNLWGQATNNAQLGQQNNQFNATIGQNNAQYNATNQQNAGANNLQAMLGTNTLNSSNLNAGIGNMGTFYGNMVNSSYAPWQAQYSRLTQGVGAVQPFYGMTGTNQTTNPVSAPNPTATGIGAAAGAYNLLKNFV